MQGSELIEKYFTDLSSIQRHQFSELKQQYIEWNAKINVVSRKDIDLLYERHVLHSLGIAKVIQFLATTKILDIGTGGGFPGIPLAILFPETNFLLVDSIGKKIKVVQSVAENIGLTNLSAKQIRAEQVEGTFDFIVSRAVTSFPEFYNWIKNKFNKKSFNTLPNGVLYLKGGDLSEELKGFKNVREYLLSNYFQEDFFLTKKVIYYPV